MKKFLIALACLSCVLSSPATLAALQQQKQNKPTAIPAQVGAKGKKANKAKENVQVKADLKKSRHHHHSSTSSSSSSCKKEHDHTWISAVALGADYSNQEVDSGDRIYFNPIVDRDGEVFYDGAGTFNTTDAGNYEITFGGRWKSAPVGVTTDLILALNINGTVLPASAVDNPGDGGDWVSISLIVDLPRNSSIQVINDTADDVSIVLDDPTGGSTSSAFITIQRLD